MVLCAHRPIIVRCNVLKSTCGLKRYGNGRKCSYIIRLGIYSPVIIPLKCCV